MNFQAEDIAQITSDACAMFGLQVIENGTGVPVVDLSGQIHIDGAWAGSVAMGCSDRFARRLACMVFDLGEEDLDQELVNDAFGELVNVTTGHIKALLPDGCRMGTPVVAGFDGSGVQTDPRFVQLWGFQADGDPLMIVIHGT